jgi:hypothetical protein
MLAHVDNRITYNGNGNTTEFAYQFKILDRTDIKVLLTDADGKEKLLTKDYYVDVEKSVVRYPGYAVGAEVPESERPPVLPTGWKLTIYREVPVTQETDLPDQYPFNQVEDIGDKLTMIAQDMKDVVARSLKVSVATSADIDTSLPWKAGISFRINDDGTKLVAMENPESVLAENKAALEASKAARDEAKRAMTAAATAAANANVSAANANVSAANAADSAELSQNSATDAARMADKAAGYVSNVTVWDSTTEYKPPDVVMTSDGSTYRCIKANANTPPQSSADCWAITSSVAAKTFEYDEKGDLMPLILPRTFHMWEAINGEIIPIAL